jgi:tetratricopeptide (TPR) repeat protein
MLLTLSASFFLALASPQTGSGDQVLLLDGTVLAVDRVTGETYAEVTFRKGTQEAKKPSDQVLEVRHSTTHRDLAEYKDGVDAKDEGDFPKAIAAFNVVLTDTELLANPRFIWARQHALFNIMRCYASVGNSEQVVAHADRLLKEVPDTFFYGQALLMKAQALQDRGNVAGAEAAYQQLLADVKAKSLPERWNREAELGVAILSKGAAIEKQRKLEGLAEKNKDQFPSVANRARVEVGNAMVQAEQYKDGKARFQAIVDGGQAEPETMAAAWSGLGDCAFNLGLREQDVAKLNGLFEEAALAYLRVAAYYSESFRLVPRALCFAGMSMDRLSKRQDAITIASKLKRSYPNSEWKTKLFNELRLQQ